MHKPFPHTSAFPAAGTLAVYAALAPDHRQLIKDTMTQDLDALEQAAGKPDALATAQMLHRIQGALLALQMRAPASHFEALEEELATGLSAGAAARIHDQAAVVRDLMDRLHAWQPVPVQSSGNTRPS